MDSRVGNELFNTAISEYLANKTRILVTHQVQFLSSPSIDRIVVMSEGRIAACGTYQQLLDARELDWVQSMYADSSEVQDLPVEDDEAADDADTDPNSLMSPVNKQDPSGPTLDLTSPTEEEAKDESKDDIGPIPLTPKDRGEVVAVINGITAAEDRAMGTVKLSTYLFYFENMGGIAKVIIMLFLLTAGQGLSVGANIWLAHWARMSAIDQKDPSNEHTYIILIVFTVLLSCVRSIVSFDYMIKAAENIQNSMLRCVIRAPLLFFDSNPIGKCLYL